MSQVSTSLPQLPFAWAQQHGVLHQQHPTFGEQLVFRQTTSPEALLEARRILPHCQLQLVSDEVFDQCMVARYQQDSDQARQMMESLGNEIDFYQLVDALPQSDDLLDSDDGAPIIRLINAMLGEAIKEGASDIHVEPFERQLAIRFRIDGELRQILSPPRQLAALLVSRIKVMAKLDIAEKRLPQDGRISLRIAGRAIDIRVSTLPSNHGERVVMRLLDKNNVRLDLSHSGMTEDKRELFGQILAQPHGIILVTGPTGSGKSTTLYAALQQINNQSLNIMTVEDPIEYDLDNIGQTQVNPKVEMTFARGLRAILRQDPDVVMIGEIRDTETAQIAVQASLTGHLVLSTLHTNSASGAIGRLRDMGVEPFLLGSSLIGVLAQRLVRTLCLHCRRQEQVSAEFLQRFGFTPSDHRTHSLYHPEGCEHCNFTGYRGRTGIHELMQVTDSLREAISQGCSEVELERKLYRQTQTIRHDGIEKVLAGITSLEEVLRVTRATEP
ncbi:type II secretion system ATPase GspE [Yersinia ruckeri]|uniref:Type II secretion system protein E n=1 Tax=Yersinia ruckeri TaxID=29486 RepID=A0A085U414_YERRU|nr:type II secretion system ATPase GspE [Yersinia ruckeri]AKA39373.1 general secretion pathway protein GspE [Yersinia ruckeri]ARZ02114.1 general secretion pathway protein E [Yersinia ruckeri]AUQ40818.1 type II secretion system protein GspE [Yersinia ruckeri]EKN3347763.1 type II secretion system ATPase GspE [Yersinia ruckeri]EKN3363047.1 type II secretion system ATPase GspE [Yersinia ruckeri]